VRRRLDVEMVRRGIVGTPSEAAQAIQSGAVAVGGRAGAKAGTLVAHDEPITLSGPGRTFVSRGGEKLEAALDRFGVDPAGRLALDAGASTGGFTDCLLQRGAAHVVAVDVGYGQLDWRLREDDRVTVLERTNVRALRPDSLPAPPDLVVADLSFISLAVVLPALVACSAPGADFVLLVKPQFEASRGEVGAGGVVADPAVWRRVLASVAAAYGSNGLRPLHVMASPLLGPAGNVEFPLHAVRSGGSPRQAARTGENAALEAEIDAAIEEGLERRRTGRHEEGPDAGA
jgi:23S rRNA (cytidine1920-2'-O)/16S rRNA (cytidine1409-2'-O)-methyltransferase